MAAGRTRRGKGQSAALMALLRAIAAHDGAQVAERLEATPDLAQQAVELGATRQNPTDYFLQEIQHYVYAGDTALHIAAAAHAPSLVRLLLSHEASVGARNRRGAEPLHYAVDGGPGSPHWKPAAQQTVVECLLEAGADPNSADKSKVTPLHRAVRTRSSAAVRALLARGADPLGQNGSGSTALHLAVQNSGRGGSGSAAAREEQQVIILLLLKHGARPTDENSAGKTVLESATGEWVLKILQDA